MQVGAGALISAVACFLAFRGARWDGIAEAFLSASALPLALGTLAFLCSWWAAAARWLALLNPAPGVRVADTFAYICIGYFGSTVLPLRLGDLARAALFGKRFGIPVSRVLAGLVVERVADIVTLLALLAPVALMMEIPLELKAAISTVIGFAAMAMVGLVALAFGRQRISRWAARLTELLPDRIGVRVLDMIDQFTTGIFALRRPSVLVGVLFWSLASWLLAGVAMLGWAQAFRLDVPWYGGLFVLIVINLGSAIPSAPGYIGVYHYLAVFALSVWISDRESALAFALATHAINMIMNVGFGAWYLVRRGLNLRQLRAVEAEAV